VFYLNKVVIAALLFWNLKSTTKFESITRNVYLTTKFTLFESKDFYAI